MLSKILVSSHLLGLKVTGHKINMVLMLIVGNFVYLMKVKFKPFSLETHKLAKLKLETGMTL